MLLWTEETQIIVRQSVLKIIRSKETTRLQWLQSGAMVQSEQAGRNFRNKDRKYLEDEIN
jgi:hypothetical protein